MGDWLVYQETGELTGLALPLWAAIAAAAMVAVLVLLMVVFAVWSAKAQRKLHSVPPAPLPVTQISVGKLHEQGARENQQDCFAVSDAALMPTHGLLAVVADGMGGLQDGDKVSAAAVQAVLDGFLLCQNGLEPRQQLLLLAQNAVQTVNSLLGPEGLRKSGSTLVMGLVKDGYFSYLSVGDSRICLLRDGILMQLNREHTYQNDLALRAVNGEMTLQEALSDPQSAGLTSFLGMGQLEHIDFPAEPLRLLPRDKLVLMSDGVYNALDGSELTQALAAEPEQAARQLQAAIQEKHYSNQDNYTAVILGCAAGDVQNRQEAADQ